MAAAKKKGNKPVQKAKPKTREQKPFAYHLIPYITAILALFLMICFISYIFCNPGSPASEVADDLAFGIVGYWICNVFMGLFGYASYIIPILLALFTIFWKNYNRRSFVVLNAIIAFVSAVIFSALMHIFLHLGSGKDGFIYFVDLLYPEGAALGGGGVVGGLLSFLLVKAFNVFGAIFFLIVVLIPMVLFLIGTTPVEATKFIAEKIRVAVEEYNSDEAVAERERKKLEKLERAEARRAAEEAEAAQDDDDDDDDADFVDEEIKEKKKPARASDKEEKQSREETVKPEEDESENKLKFYGFSNEEKVHMDSLKTEKGASEDELDEFERDEKSAGEVFDEDVNDSNADSNTVVFGDPNSQSDKNLGHDVVDDLVSQRFDENYTVDESTGEVFTPMVQTKAPKSAAEFRDMDKKDEEYFIGERPEPVIPEYNYPPTDLLVMGPSKYSSNPDEIRENEERLEEVLRDFRIPIKEITCSCGPTITRYEIKPEAGVRVKQIANLVDDISMALARSGVRIEAPIPGKAAVGIEVPNEKPSAVKLRNLIETQEFVEHKSKLASCLGADVSGNPVVFDIEKMPHLLVAGTTGSGKSVCINSIIMSILYHAKPSEVKLLLIDPKKVEFKIYKDIPHLCCRIISDPKKAAGALNSAVNEMEKRFELIEEVGVRNITGYNEATKNDPDKPFMPRMVIIIDEFADLMMTAKEEVETAVVRIAQKARAAGIHLIIGTQRPSVDVITGLIKANVPSRIAFTVMSQVDSRTILDGAGAEKLCGKGDMLYAPVGASKPQRVQGAFVSDDEVEAVVEYVKSHNAPVVYDQEFESSIENEAAKCGNAPDKAAGTGELRGGAGDDDSLLFDAAELAIDSGKIATSMLQRRLSVGYGRAAKIIDRLEEMGVVGPPEGTKPRKILMTRDELEALRESMDIDE